MNHILSCMNISELDWYNDCGEAYIIENNEFGASLFGDNEYFIDGEMLQKRLSDNRYYVIFADLKGFPRNIRVKNLKTYEEFIASECTFVILVVDCEYVTIYSKDMAQVKLLFEQAKVAGYENIEIVKDENDTRTRLSTW